MTALLGDPKLTDTLLYLDGVAVSFDGYKALRGLSLILAPGEMRAIIGPNGAGKTTMMDVITGKTRPDTGDVYFEGRHDLTKLDETEIAQLGVGRKFQKPTVFENHTVSDNILLAAKAPRAVFATLFGGAAKQEQETIERILSTIRLRDERGRLAGSLSHGQKQWLEDRHAARAGPEASARRRTRRRHDRSETAETAELLKGLRRTIPSSWWSMTWRSSVNSASRSPCWTRDRC